MTLTSGFQPLLAFATVPVLFITDDPDLPLRYVILLGALADVRNAWPAGLAASMRNSATTIATSCSQMLRFIRYELSPAERDQWADHWIVAVWRLARRRAAGRHRQVAMRL